jgi:hypothetical protein
MDRIIVATSVVVALTVTGSAGCAAVGGGSSGAGTPTARTSSPSAAIYHQAAACIRAHGAPNFPDPVRNPQTGKWELPPGTRKPPESVMNACRSLLDQIPEARGDDESAPPMTPDQLAKARQWAQCMRRHGLSDWPDPQADGTFVLPPRLAAGGKRAFRSQLEACRKYEFGGIRIRARANG